jgi:hypothetical protein
MEVGMEEGGGGSGRSTPALPTGTAPRLARPAACRTAAGTGSQPRQWMGAWRPQPDAPALAPRPPPHTSAGLGPCSLAGWGANRSTTNAASSLSKNWRARRHRLSGKVGMRWGRMGVGGGGWGQQWAHAEHRPLPDKRGGAVTPPGTTTPQLPPATNGGPCTRGACASTCSSFINAARTRSLRSCSSGARVGSITRSGAMDWGHSIRYSTPSSTAHRTAALAPSWA